MAFSKRPIIIRPPNILGQKTTSFIKSYNLPWKDYGAVRGATSVNSSNPNAANVSARKIYVGSVPFDISLERLLSAFSAYGEIEEGPLGFDKATGKSKGFAFFVYKTEEGARAALVEPLKTIDGHHRGYSDGPHYGLGSSVGHLSQNQQPPVPRIPPGGLYQGMPPYC